MSLCAELIFAHKPSTLCAKPFRDIAINNAFIDASITPILKHKRIFLIDPYADSIIKNNIPELDKFIEPINKRFEDINVGDFKY